VRVGDRARSVEPRRACGSRGLQGAFGAVLASSALEMLTTTFTEAAERGNAFGISGARARPGAAVGLLLGGVLKEYLSWRWCPCVNVAIAVPAICAALVLMTNQAPAERPKLDVPGAVAGWWVCSRSSSASSRPSRAGGQTA
jgi:MFS family permease